MDVENKLLELYQKIELSQNNCSFKSNIFYSIIQIKKRNENFKNVINTIYQDKKLFISNYISSIEEKDLGYDIINTNKIITCLEFFENIQEKYLLAQFTYRLLKKRGFEDESKVILKIINATKTSIIKSKPSCVKKYIELILHLSSYSITSILLTISLLFIVSLIALLPAPFESWGVYNVSYQHYSNIFLINHIVNILTNIFDIKNNFNVETNSIIGILSILFIKFFYLVFIVNFLYTKIIDILKNK